MLITSAAKRDVALAAAADCPRLELILVVDDPGGAGDDRVRDYATAIAEHPTEPIPDERLGTAMLYSSGTTGRPKGIIRPLPDQPPTETLPLFTFLSNLWRYREDMIYLSPAPLYHSAPQAAVGLTIATGGTVVIMERFDPVEYLRLIEQYQVTHTQLVPTMFSRMLKLPEDVRTRYDVSSLQVAVHAAAPCPVTVKHQMIDWWGPVIHEYYAGTEGNGFIYCNSDMWLGHPGTVGAPINCVVHIVGEDGEEVSQGESGTVFFESNATFEYHNDPEKTKSSRHPKGWTTLGDVGYLDADGFLYLTDRKAYMIITGGVNVYPQEAENLLVTHPAVVDVAVFGVPNDDFGEEVKGVVQPVAMPADAEAAGELERELIRFCREHLADVKCPRSVDFRAELPRHPTGKLYKRLLKDEYWAAAGRSI